MNKKQFGATDISEMNFLNCLFLFETKYFYLHAYEHPDFRQKESFSRRIEKITLGH